MVEVVILVVNIIILFQVQFPEYSMGGSLGQGFFVCYYYLVNKITSPIIVGVQTNYKVRIDGFS